MWPFSKKRDVVVAEVVFDGVVANFDRSSKTWNFCVGGYSYYVSGGKIDVAVFEAVKAIPDELEALSEKIQDEIKKQLQEFYDYEGNEEIFGINVTELLCKGQYDVGYSGDDKWGDMMVNVVVENGEIVDSYSGD